jgi:hypothetical protein
VLFLRAWRRCSKDVLDVARTWGAGAASRYACAPSRNRAKNRAAS